ncbi:transaldolase family protein [Salimicrobium album]|uniref:Fructose-6-phosphate aldolase 2 n=1 Tax=Salimicrobium album TaxID=50717 RepID=A0A1H3IMK7_9BACI|nr:transaldolase family protein [Salimicrobium album]SDY28940.1 fructose-6-phosphate aldolase 2 [Salimicrobium album]
MKILIDSANIEDIRNLQSTYPIQGVTTNPSILAKEVGAPETLLQSIYSALDKNDEFHIQVTRHDADAIVQESYQLIEKFGEKTFIKIPVSIEGYKAMRILNNQGLRTTATAVFTTKQAVFAALAGADYIAPYVNRIDNYNGDGTEMIRSTKEILQREGLSTEVLAASFKNTKQVEDAILAGASVVTIPPELMHAFVHHEGTDDAIEGFMRNQQKSDN